MPQVHRAASQGSTRRSITVVATVLAMVTGALAGQAPPAHAATADKIAPVAAPTGTGITIAGTELLETSAVTFLGAAGPEDDAAAAHFIALDAKKLVVQVPPTAQNGPIAVTTPAGTATTPVEFIVYAAPSISGLSASWGKPDDVLTITGQNLIGAKKAVVTFGAKKATPFTTSGQTELQLKVPAGLLGGPVPLAVTTTGGVARSEFTIGPAVKGIAPKAGTSAGGTIASITGSGFTGVDAFTDDPATAEVDESMDGVTIGGTRVTDMIVVSDKEVVVEVPPGTDAAASVVVSTKHGDTVSTSGDLAKFTYQPIPVVTSMSKNWNAVGEASEVVLTGRNLTATTTVTVGSLAATSAVADVEAGTLTVTPPVGVKAAASTITVANATPAGTLFKAVVPFGYIEAPVVTKLTPTSAQAGATVLVAGTGFDKDATVSFGGTAATCRWVSFVSLSCVAPGGTGPVDVTVTNGVGPSLPTAASSFTHLSGSVAPPPVVGLPTVSAMLPPFGRTGSTIELKGANYTTLSKIEFSGPDGTWVEAPQFMVVAPGRVVITVPAEAQRGELRVTNASGQIETFGRIFTKTVAPSIATIDVLGDTTVGATSGDLLKIRGQGLFIKGAKTIVTIGGKAAAIQGKPAPNPNTIVVKVPPALGGQESVVVSTALGSATAASQLYYLPEVKAVKPMTYSRLGDTVATISGFGFTGVDNVTVLEGRLSAVTFRDVKVAKLVFMSDKLLVAVTSPGSATADDLVVTTQHGGRFGNSLGKTRSVDVPMASIAAATPNTGPAGSAQSDITLTGTHLYANSVVKFGAAVATVKSAEIDGTSMVVTPPTRTTPGTVGITVTNVDDGEEYTTTTPGLYTYSVPPATVTAMSAATGQPGASVTITGTNFIGVTNVRFDTVEATFTAVNETTLVATVPVTPSTLQGMATDVTVINSSGQPSLGDPSTADDWTWSNNPIVTGMTPLTGFEGSTITIIGSGFTGATAVWFGEVAADGYTVVDDRTISATVPTTPSAGSLVNVKVVARGLDSPEPLNATDNDWTWTPIAAITNMTPNPGAAGSTITVTGRNFVGVRSVTVNGVDVTASVVVQGSTQLTFTAPPRPAGNAADRTDKPVYIINGSNVQSTADINPTTSKAANLFTWS